MAGKEEVLYPDSINNINTAGDDAPAVLVFCVRLAAHVSNGLKSRIRSVEGRI